MTAPLPANDGLESEALRRLGILDPSREQRFDRIARLAALALDCPIAFICFVDRERVWFKAAHGAEFDALPRDHCVCALAILTNDMVVINDSAKDVRCHNDPLFVRNPRLRFLACCPLLANSGADSGTDSVACVGALCVGDVEPRDACPREIEILRHCSFLVREQLQYDKAAGEPSESDFLATAAHELRSPLASVYGFSELLLQQQFTPAKRRELLEIIHGQSHQMARLVNELLDLARLEAKAGRDFVMTRQSPVRLVEAVLRDFMLPAKRQPIELHIAANLPDICVDGEKTRQALGNILSNAFKYSPQGGPVTLMLDSDGQSVSIRIRDQGVGIPPAALSRIFEKFFRVEDSPAPGTGLGMALVKEIIERQQGEVRVDSEFGKWTEVTVLLPIAC